MPDQYFDIATHLLLALAAGSLIGLERTYSGRPAGFRTHGLVCVASAMLMLITTYQNLWLHMLPIETVRTDPTRMAQGIMTGIGFLGAGVIFKEGLTVRGLTTAASIWMTAAIGTLIGVGFYYPAILATAITFGMLSVFRIIEIKMPTRHYARNIIRFQRNQIMPEPAIRALLEEHRFDVAKMGYSLSASGEIFEYQMVIKTIDKRNLAQLSQALLALPNIMEFQLITIAN